jgi:hypothetical protein
MQDASFVLTAAGIAVTWAAAARGGAPASFPISRQSQAQCVIVAQKQHEALAKELQHWLRQMTWATLPIEAEPAEQPAIVLGLTTDHPDQAKTQRPGDLGPEAIVLRTEANRLWLLANTELGLQHAVFRLLNAAGCRWFFPDPVWTVIPSKPDLSLALNLREQPAFGYRRIWYGWGPRTETLKRDYSAWMRHNRQYGHFRTDCGHAWHRHVPRQLFKKHPEWFALVDGERKPTQLCVTNRELQEFMANRVLQAFREHPDALMVSVEPNDGGGYCRCETCKELGSISDGVFHLANEVAKVVRQEFPDRWVGLYAYAKHSEPPSFPIEPGVYVQVTTGFRYTELSFDQQVTAFRKLGARLGVYDYFSVYPWDRDMPGAAKAGRVYQLAEAIRHYRDLGLSTYDAESSCNWGPNGLGYWMASRLMWNPDLEAQALVRDFCSRAFGQAAEPMRRLYERWASGERFSRRGLKLALLDLKEAYGREKDAAVGARLNRVAMYLHWLRLWSDYDRAARWNQWNKLAVASPEEVIAKAKEVVIYSRRLMDTGLIHTHPMLFTSWFKRRFKALGKIDDFDWEQTEAWKTERTDIPSAEETAQHFAADLAALADLPAVELQHRDFSEQLVPLVERRPEAVEAWGEVARSPLFVEDGVHYFIGKEGEALRLSYTPFGKGHTVDCRWTLRRPGQGKPLAKGHVKAAKGEAATIDLSVTKPGLLAFDPGTDYWKAAQIGFRPRPLALWAGRADRPGSPKRTPLRLWRPRLNQPLYFYVPEGTRHFVLCIASGGDPFTKLRIRTADGSAVLKNDRVLAGAQLSVTVPEGKDGAVWSLELDSLRCVVELYDVPPYLARHPAELLVPADTVP